MRRFLFSLIMVLGISGAMLAAQPGGALAQGQVDKLNALSKRAQQGDPMAQFFIGGLMLEAANKDPSVLPDAVNYLRKSAEQGYAMAQTQMGLLHVAGHGVSKDAVAGVNWLQMAADQGDAKAQYNLGIIYVTGEGGIPVDPIKGAQFIAQAAAQGHEKAKMIMQQVQ